MYNGSMPEDLNSELEPVEDASDASQPIFKPMSDAYSSNKPRVLNLALIGALLLVVAGISFLIWSRVRKTVGGPIKPLGDTANSVKLSSQDKPILLENPITGELVPEEKAGPINERPLAVMVNNYVDARPQSGLIYADIVYEIVAEGGITRLIPFYLSTTPTKIGPVRSTREYYLVLVKELGDAMIMHIGWSPQALEAIQTWPVRSLGRGGATFWRENPRNVAIEHTAYVNGLDLRELGLKLGWEGRRDFRVWKFKDDSPLTTPEASNIEINFWYKGPYTTTFKYDQSRNEYLRFNGFDAEGNPIATKDQETGEQVAVKNVIVQFAKETPIEGDEKHRLEYDLVGSGSGLVFRDGGVMKVTWSKASRDERTLFYDEDGNEVQFNRGKFWVCIVPARNMSQVTYTN